jgi:hypothetical protein
MMQILIALFQAQRFCDGMDEKKDSALDTCYSKQQYIRETPSCFARIVEIRRWYLVLENTDL